MGTIFRKGNGKVAASMLVMGMGQLLYKPVSYTHLTLPTKAYV